MIMLNTHCEIHPSLILGIQAILFHLLKIIKLQEIYFQEHKVNKLRKLFMLQILQ